MTEIAEPLAESFVGQGGRTTSVDLDFQKVRTSEKSAEGEFALRLGGLDLSFAD